MPKEKRVKLGDASIGKNMRVYAIGDVHGCLREMKSLLKLIGKDLKDRPIKKHRIIFLGDYVDRGPNSREVLDCLIKLRETNSAVECLLGNHDEKVIRLHGELESASLDNFLRYGGAATLKSYGFSKLELTVLKSAGFSGAIRKAFMKTVRNRIPVEHEHFLLKLPRSLVEGDYFFCHAGVRPDVVLDDQSAEDLVGIREPFLSHAKALPKIIVHGHTRQKAPDVRSNRINVDTSCCYGHALTALVLEGTEHSFLKVTAEKTYWT